VSLTLDLPGGIWRPKKGTNVKEAIRDAFAEIERQVEKYKASLRGEQYGTLTRREEIRRKRRSKQCRPMNAIASCSSGRHQTSRCRSPLCTPLKLKMQKAEAEHV